MWSRERPNEEGYYWAYYQSVDDYASLVVGLVKLVVWYEPDGKTYYDVELLDEGYTVQDDAPYQKNGTSITVGREHYPMYWGKKLSPPADVPRNVQLLSNELWEAAGKLKEKR